MMIWRLRFLNFLILIIFTLNVFVFGQESSISIDSHVDKSTITIGDLIKYTIVITHSREVQVEMPVLAANLGDFEIRDYDVYEPETIDGKEVERVEYDISTFDVGEFEIPPLEFRYVLPGDSIKHVLKTKKIKILVESLKPSEAGDVRDIKNPLEQPRNYRKFILWGSVGFASLLLLIAMIYIWHRKRAGKGLLPQKVEPPRPAHEIALEELNALKESSLLAESRIKEFYIELSEIIRRYVEGRYFIIALEMTTFELIGNLDKSEVEPEIVQMIQEFLEFCDLVKFAKYKSTEEENSSSLDRAFEIVEKSKLIYDQVESETTMENETEVKEPSENENSLVENF